MLCKQNLTHKDYGKRKTVFEQEEGVWKNFFTLGVPGKEIDYINRYHFTPVMLKGGYRIGTNIVSGAFWILIDVDTKGSNVEELLRKRKLYFLKVPSGSASDDVTYKWHFLVKTEQLSDNANVAREQILHFYETLGLVNYDPNVAGDAVRYFAPCGCGEVAGSKAHTKRMKWCNKNSIRVKGDKWSPLNRVDAYMRTVNNRKVRQNASSHSKTTKKEVKLALKEILNTKSVCKRDAEGTRIVGDVGLGYEDSLAIGMALYNWCPKRGFKLWVKWAEAIGIPEKYTRSYHRKWDGFGGGDRTKYFTIGTVFYYAYGEKKEEDIFQKVTVRKGDGYDIFSHRT